MTKSSLLLIPILILTLMSQSAWGRRVPAEQAGLYARNWWLQKDGNQRAVLQQVQTEFENIYLFVDTAGHGFVMLAADDRSLPVLGYSLRNNFVTDSMPDHVRSWIQGYNDQIQYLIDNNIEKTTEINAQWQDLNNTHSQLPAAWSSGKGPLLTTKWAQKSKTTTKDHFNNYCPEISGTKCLTGCVATAMAQIMNYHEFPLHGVGSNTYTPLGFSYTLSADFANATYDWANMPDNPNSYTPVAQDQAIALLMYHVGVAVNMNYGTGDSNAKTVSTNYDEPAAVNAYKRYFKYKWTTRCVYMGDYSESGWKQLLKNEIDNNRPIQYSGSDEGSGHSFVCDGYNTSEQFHFNWGWYGTSDGYFTIGALNPSSYYYNKSNKAIVGIEPDKTTGSTITISASPNDAARGTVNGQTYFSQTYNKYQDVVTLTPAANEGYRFTGWSNGNKEVPLKFLANGNSASLTANFEPVEGDTLYYCNTGHAGSVGTWNSLHFAAIKIPAGSLVDGSKLTHVMFYSITNYYYTINIYKGSFKATPDYTITKNPGVTDAWASIALDNPQTIDGTQDLYIAVGSYTYSATSMRAANADASYESTNPGAGASAWSQCQSGGGYVTWMIKGVTVNTQHTIKMNSNAVHLNSLSANENLRSAGLGVSNQNATVNYEIVSCTPPNIATITDYYKLTATGVGTVRIKAYATDAQSRYAENFVDLQIERGTLVFDTWDGVWSSAANWTPHVLPDSVNHNVLIKSRCTVDCDAQCHDLSINYSCIMTVARNARLEVSGELSTYMPWNVTIKADASGSGTVIYGSGTPEATVEMYLKGTADADGMNPQWQLRGSLVDNFDLEYPSEWANIHVYEWDETNNVNGCWTNKMEGSAISLKPWKGYGFANYSTTPTTVTYTGTLVNPNKQWTLSKTGSGNANVGNNMLTNSYSAPIAISEITFTNAQSSVIFYNTGSLEEWRQYGGDLSQSGTSPGQFLVCPKSSAGAAGMPTSIPSGQSFYVVANSDGATVDVNYSDVNKSASGPLYIPVEEDEFNVLGIRVKGDYGADRAVLLECEECGENYDDGYDGMKFFGGEELPQLYVVNSFGRTSINADRLIVGQRLGLTCKPGRLLRMSFETEKLSGYRQLMLHDLLTDRYVDIVAGEEYEFTTTESDAARFEVVSNRVEKGNEDGMAFSGNALFTGNAEGSMIMCDMCGRIVWQTDAKRNDLVYLPETLHGVYVIKSDNSTLKIVK